MTSEPMSQAEFARRAGYAKSYVTALKQAGRLVMTADGRVDAAASVARIEATRDPNRDDLESRRAGRMAALQGRQVRKVQRRQKSPPWPPLAPLPTVQKSAAATRKRAR